jgi:hypothetical protein
MVGIPESYETELQAVISALGDMKQTDVRWEVAGTRGVGVLVSDTMMFERAAPQPSDQYLGSFYGLAMPLVKRGIPVEPVQIESSATPGFLDRYKLLLLTYEGQKPPTPEFHAALATWVRNGGALLVVDNDDDPFNAVREWWNTAPNSYKTPREHLFARLEIPEDAEGLFHLGRGVVLSERVSPSALSYQADGGDTLRNFAREAAAAAHLKWSETNALVLRRGPYVIAAGLDESVPGKKAPALHGEYVDLFDAGLPVRSGVTVAPGTRALLYDLGYDAGHNEPRIAAAACRVHNEQFDGHALSFSVDGIADTKGVIRIQTRMKPKAISIGSRALGAGDYEVDGDTVLLHFANSIEPVKIQIEF